MDIGYTSRDRIGFVELNAPPRNALASPAFADEARLRGFLAREDVDAVVVYGAGRNFCAGADLEALEARRRGAPAGLGEELAAGKRLLETIRAADLPVIAAIRGACLGAGLEIALACHFRVAAGSAMLGFPEAEHGLIPGLGGTLLAGVGVPRGAAIDLLLTGRLIRGDEALAIRLVDRAVETREVLPEAERLARALTDRRSRAQIRGVMTAVRNAERLDRDRALAEETKLFLALAAGIER